jgi:hypothetical protein
MKTLEQLIADKKFCPRHLGTGLGYRFAIEQLERDIAALPRCIFEGCEAPATGGHDGKSKCCSAHRQKQWAFTATGVARPPEFGTRVSEGKTGHRRPDKTPWWQHWHKEADVATEKLKTTCGLVDAEDVARERGLRRGAVIAGFRKAKLEPLRARVGGQWRALYWREDADAVVWPRRGESGKRAWKIGDGWGFEKIKRAGDAGRLSGRLDA